MTRMVRAQRDASNRIRLMSSPTPRCRRTRLTRSPSTVPTTAPHSAGRSASPRGLAVDSGAPTSACPAHELVLGLYLASGALIFCIRESSPDLPEQADARTVLLQLRELPRNSSCE